MQIKSGWGIHSGRIWSFRGHAIRVALFCIFGLFLVGQANAQGSFTNTGPLNTARYYHSATLLNNGNVLIVGGCYPGSNVVNTAEIYNPATKMFSYTHGSLNTARCDHTATLLLDHRVLITGGFGPGGSGVLQSAEIYDPASDSFATVSPMHSKRVYDSATLLPSGKVLIAGGNSTGGTSTVLNTAELFDPASGTFTLTSNPMTTPREYYTQIMPSTLLNNNTVLLEGGATNGPTLLQSAEVYDYNHDTFTAVGSLVVPRWYHTATLLQDGTALIVAGDNISGFLTSAEIYSPSGSGTGTFALTGSLSTARIDHTETLLNNGMVLIAGGITCSGGNCAVPLSSAERYTPSLRTFAPAGTLNTARYWHTATNLLDGTVLIVGGYNGTNALASAEIYTPGNMYYISYSSGSNLNSGDKQHPWKSHPYMQNATGCAGTPPTYTHSAGDQFIFKQGDSWPNACFDMVIQYSGAAGNPDQFTFDPTWGNAGGIKGNRGQNVGVYQFTAAIAGVPTAINGADGINRFVYDNGHDNIVFNGVELTGVTWSGLGGGGDNVWLVDIQASQNFVLSNCYAHNWTYTNPVDYGDALGVMVGNGNPPYNAGSKMTGCVVDGSNSGGPGVANSGDATYAIPGCDNNIIMNVTNGCLLNANGIVHDNQIGPVNQSFSIHSHENCIEPIDMQGSNGGSPGASTVLVYNNVIHDCTAAGVLFGGAASNGGWELDYAWNNVYYVGTASPRIPFAFANVNNTKNGNWQIHAWNNTVYGGPSGTSVQCFRTFSNSSLGTGPGTNAVIDFQNNQCISDQGLWQNNLGATTVTNNNNPTMSTQQATNAGLSSMETNAYPYQPTSSSCGGQPNCPVGAGANLTSTATGNFVTLSNDTTFGGTRITNVRPSSGPWDAGAYLFH
jgi:hypothetical protein